jgi:hypothetical protein
MTKLNYFFPWYTAFFPQGMAPPSMAGMPPGK